MSERQINLLFEHFSDWMNYSRKSVERMNRFKRDEKVYSIFYNSAINQTKNAEILALKVIDFL